MKVVSSLNAQGPDSSGLFVYIKISVVTSSVLLNRLATPLPAVAVRLAQTPRVCAHTRDRTWDLTSISRVLYQLSYMRNVDGNIAKIYVKRKRSASI